MGSADGPFTYRYPRPSVTVDIVLVTRELEPRVLLIRRIHPPYAGFWALPGGFVNENERLIDAARRELVEETGVLIDQLEQLHTFGDPGRDPRGWTVSVVYWAQLDAAIEPKAGDDAGDAAWYSLHYPPPLAFDHAEILGRIRARLADRAG